jgi:NAD(P) transhydrogenase subunit alpha
MGRVVAEADVVITTAVVPGRTAPVLITPEMVAGMAPGSLVVDLAAERGGNCALTQPGETVEAHGVTILGPVNLASTVPYHASHMYARTLSALFLHVAGHLVGPDATEGAVTLAVEDEIVRETLVTRGGAVVHPRVRDALGGGKEA